MSKGTFHGSKRKRARKSGFLSRMKTVFGRRILSKRRKKNRKKISS
uniref:Large ribosomal subunit protein bL34c n=2 Tax=Kappaphycus TaxID=38543 RepID=A0A2H4FFW1_9FLOR|nr:50S ribosomal protein L34 [Kappaphycus striatus]